MSSTTTEQHEFVDEVRREISALDRDLVELVNRRLELVAKLWRYKDANGLDAVDLAREEALLRSLQESNRGPLSEAGLRRLFTELLAIVKDEVSGRP